MTHRSAKPAIAPDAITIELAQRPVVDTTNLLAQFVYGEQTPENCDNPGLPPLAGGPVYEIWRAPGDFSCGQQNGVNWRSNGDLLFASLAVPLGGDAAAATRRLYQQIFDCIAALDFAHLLRIWNFMPGINQGAGDKELYKLFCAGRAQAFDDNTGGQWQVPAATAVGISGEQAGADLIVHFLAAREPGQRLENSRQVSATDYPRIYGPRSPQFARATAWPDNHPSVLLVSGTASILGHASQHLNDLDHQLRETWQNLEQLKSAASAHHTLGLRVYIRRPTDFAQVRDYISAQVPAQVPVLYLHADICRAELLLEIEAVYAIPAS